MEAKSKDIMLEIQKYHNLIAEEYKTLHISLGEKADKMILDLRFTGIATKISC